SSHRRWIRRDKSTRAVLRSAFPIATKYCRARSSSCAPSPNIPAVSSRPSDSLHAVPCTKFHPAPKGCRRRCGHFYQRELRHTKSARQEPPEWDESTYQCRNPSSAEKSLEIWFSKTRADVFAYPSKHTRHPIFSSRHQSSARRYLEEQDFPSHDIFS